MITATITNVVKDADGIRVSYSFSDATERNQLFPADSTRMMIKQAIKQEVDDKNTLQSKVDSFQDLINDVIS